MPNTGILMLGALGLMWLARGQNGNGQEPRSIGSLLSADIESSGMYGGGSSQVLTAPVIGPEATRAVLSGNTAFTAMAVAADTGIPKAASKLAPPTPEIAGTLSALFAAQGPTISEISGNAVRQVGLLASTESILNTANEPSVAIVNITTPADSAPVMLEEDEPIEVLPPREGTPEVLTIFGDDQSTVVTTGINRSATSYFTTPGTLVAAVDQGYFTPPPAYVPRTWQQIETDWDIAQGLPDRHEETEVATVAVVPEPPGYATGLDWI
jgi:hypothetical protein